jgi:hypothetical protein
MSNRKGYPGEVEAGDSPKPMQAEGNRACSRKYRDLILKNIISKASKSGITCKSPAF